MKFELFKITTKDRKADVPKDARIIYIKDDYIAKQVNHSPGVEYISTGEYYIEYVVMTEE